MEEDDDRYSRLNPDPNWEEGSRRLHPQSDNFENLNPEARQKMYYGNNNFPASACKKLSLIWKLLIIFMAFYIPAICYFRVTHQLGKTVAVRGSSSINSNK